VCLRERLGLGALANARQVHGTMVRHVTEDWLAPDGGNAAIEADGLVTMARRVGLIAFTADCLPVALGADGAVAMLHAGWRGLAEGVLEQGVRELREMAGPAEISAVIGPGAGACCYEVGSEVHAAFGRPDEERGPLDLKAAARERLQAAGVADVRDLGVCTICDRRFFSHRREGARAGRQVGVAWLR
jgi:YfiH family protein